MKKKSEGLPPNFDSLPTYVQMKLEEQVYRRQLMASHGRLPGDPCLKSMGKEGVPVRVGFGKKFELKDDEEDL